MPFESTAVYYNLINKMYQEKAGDVSSVRLVLSSLNMQEVTYRQQEGNWDELCSMLCTAAGDLACQADFLVICSDPMHKLASAVSRSVGMEVLDIRHVVATEIHSRGFKTVGLLGTSFMMTEDFYRGYLEKRGIKVLIPDKDGIELVDYVICDELSRGRVMPVSEECIQHVIEQLTEKGAEAIILCGPELQLIKCTAVPHAPLMRRCQRPRPSSSSEPFSEQARSLPVQTSAKEMRTHSSV